MSDVDELDNLRAAFDGDDIARKNIALRAAHDAITALRARVAELEEAVRNALSCTPHICVGQDGYEIRYDCGDPWEILRSALLTPSSPQPEEK
jgi:hypothetical protein